MPYVEIVLPENVKFIIERMNEFGYRADIVGGSVRDALLGVTVQDYDLTTDATPEQTKSVFSDFRILDTGLKHGTVTLLLGTEQYEITTYRLDGEYKDNRRPETVTFTSKLEEDLSRRDFTVNAMCYNTKDGITDLFGGEGDLRAKILRAVGDPTRRFDEDALRILRAVRFASVLGFDIEPKTKDAVIEKCGLLKNVSGERIYTEWRKLLGGAGAYGVLREFSSVVAVICPELERVVLPEKSRFASAGWFVRLLSLYALSCSSPDEDFSRSMHRLKTDNATRTLGEKVLSNYKDADLGSDEEIQRLLMKVGEDVAGGIVSLREVLGIAQAGEGERLSSALRRKLPHKVSHLAFDGRDAMSLGLYGERVGQTLNALLDAVIRGECENSNEALTLRARSMWQE